MKNLTKKNVAVVGGVAIMAAGAAVVAKVTDIPANIRNWKVRQDMKKMSYWTEQ